MDCSGHVKAKSVIINRVVLILEIKRNNSKKTFCIRVTDRQRS